MKQICEVCGKSFRVYPSNPRRFCSRACYGAASVGKNSPKPSREVLVDLYEIQGLTTSTIGEKFGVQGQTVLAWLKKEAIHVRQDQKKTQFAPGLVPHNKLPTPPRSELDDLYNGQGLTAEQIAIRYGVSGGAIKDWMESYGLKRRHAGVGLLARGIEPPTREQLQEMVHSQHMYYREIGELYGVDQSAVMHWLDKHGIARPQTWYDRHSNPESLSELRALYEAGWSLDEIGQRYGISRIQVGKLLRNNGVQLRRDGWQGGKRFTASDGRQVRSTYECKVADWLHDHGLNYVYEPALPFSSVWRADFWANGWFVEIWGVLNSENYKRRKEAKQEHYRAYHIALIELPVHSFHAVHNDLWKRKLSQCLQPPLL